MTREVHHRIKPTKGARVRHPDTGQILDADGVLIQGDPSPHWLRRQADGEVTIEPEKPAPIPTPADKEKR